MEIFKMDALEKAKIRIEHWISHNQHHYEEYEAFAQQLEDSGKNDSAKQIRDMMVLTKKSTDCLQKALVALD